MKKIVIAYAFLIIILSSVFLTSCQPVKGESAYEIAVRNGFVGSEAEWLDSLKGDPGKNGSDGNDGKNGLNGTGISLIKTDKNGHIIIILDNGKTVDLGKIETPENDTSTEAPVLNTSAVTLTPDSFWLLSANRPVSYTSSDASVAQITDNGIIIALSEGTATITATTADTQIAICNVSVINYTYRYLSDKSLEITGYFGSSQSLTIPSEIKGLPVTSIGDSAFKDFDLITSVIIPSSITSIGSYAFAGCSALSAVEMPETTSYIGNSFEGTPWLLAQQNISFTDVTPETVYAFPVGELLAEIYSVPSVNDSFKLADLNMGVQLERNGISQDTGWSRVKLNGSDAYIRTSRLTYNKFTEYIKETEIYPTNSNDEHIPGIKPNVYLEDKQINGITPLIDGTPVKVLAVCYENEGEVFGWSYIQHENSYYFIRNSQLKCYMESFNESNPPVVNPDVPSGMKEIISKDCSYPQGGTDYINNDNSNATLPSADELDQINVSSQNTSTDPLVLIVHTHGTEAFTEDGVIYFDPTKPSSRSNDITKNVVSLGKIMADALNGKGISTLHCEIAFDEQDYDNSYTRAAQKIQEYLEEYPSIKYVIDIHRDSIDTSDGSGNRIKPVIGVGDTTAAQVMFVVAAGSESDHPNWKANLALAQRLREEMHGTAPGICRPTMLKDKADYYNQQYSAFSILLEIGTDCNTLAEATLSAELAAEAIAKTIIE